MGYLDYPGLQRYHGKIQEEIDELKDDLNYSKTAPDGYILTSTDEGNGTKWSPVGLPTDEQTAQAVSDWLDEHPEATTTVQDHSLTFEKLVLGTLNYVTPEMYGAKGDGITDDTEALQDALSSGNAVILASNTYLLSDSVTLENADFYCSGELKFTNGGFIIDSTRYHDILINKITQNNNTDDGSVCLSVKDSAYCNISVGYMSGFSQGIILVSESSGTFMNNICIKQCSCLRGLDIKATSGGFVNANIVDLLYFPFTFTGVNTDVYAVQFTSGNTNVYNSNNIKIRLEWTDTSWNYKPKGIIINKGNYNIVDIVRTEINGGSGTLPDLVTFAGTSNGNIVNISDPFYISSYSLHNYSTFRNYVYYDGEDLVLAKFKKIPYEVTALDVGKMSTSKGLNLYTVTGIETVQDYQTTYIAASDLYSYWYRGADLRFVNTKNEDSYIVIQDTKAYTGCPFILMLQMFDSNGDFMTDSELITTQNDYLNSFLSFYLHASNTVGVYRQNENMRSGISYIIHFSKNVKEIVLSPQGMPESIYVSDNLICKQS